ncbi:hypothetical protein EOM39_06455 [Candidatus Gracilibacteria bacterium]|nr:hypothetical protein [Candidatus Gracilibacteria bacterium]
MNIRIGELNKGELLDVDLLETDTSKFRGIINNLVSNKEEIDTEKVANFFIEKVNLILETNFINEKLMIDGYEIIGIGEFKELPNGDRVVKINIKGHSKTDILYLTKDFEIFKTESGRQVFYIGQIVDVIKKRTGEKTGKGTGIIIENGIGSSPVLLVYKKGIMLNTYPQINPFIGER